MIYRTQIEIVNGCNLKCFFREVDYGTYIDRQTLNKEISEGKIPISCDNCNFLIGHTI